MYKDDNIFSFKKVNISYENNSILKDISLNISYGEKISLIGPSGAGKTTLLKALYDQNPTECSFIHQDFSLVDPLSVYNNVYIGRLDRYSFIRNVRNLIYPIYECKIEINSILEKIGIPEKIFTNVKELSGGQKQRVAIARALFHGKKVLLADEPVSSVDPARAESLLSNIYNSRDTVIASIHNIDLAKLFSSRLIGIRKGKIFFDKPTERVNQNMLDDLFAIGN